MIDPYVAALVWRLEHMTQEEQRVREFVAGQLAAELSDRQARLRRWLARLRQPFTAPWVKPAMNRSRKRLNTNAIGTATSTVAACSDCQK
jgi:hypothetical protein